MRLARTLAYCFFSVASLPGLAQDGPPAPQNFGPDTYDPADALTRGDTTPTPLTCNAKEPSARICTGFLASIDGARLDVTLRIPQDLGKQHPLVVLLHGWGGSKESLGEFAEPLFKDGHAVLRYSARGFGKSWGQANLADIHLEMEDLRSIVGQLVDKMEFNLNADAIGLLGVSYGGGQSWLALTRPTFQSPGDGSPQKTVRIRAVVPIVPWTDLVYSLVPNGRPQFSLDPAGSTKWSFVNGLYLSGVRDDPERPYPNYADYLPIWHARLQAEPDNNDALYRQIRDGVAGYRSIWWRPEFWAEAAAHRVPVFQLQGMTDDLFPLPEAKRMLLALKSVDPIYPIASYFGDIGHPRAANKEGELQYALGLIRDWFAYYLLQSATAPVPQHVIRAAITRPRDQAFDVNDVITVASYAELATETLEHRFTGSERLVNPVADPYSGFTWDPVLMEQALKQARELRPSTSEPPEPAFVPGSIAVYRVRASELVGAAPLLIAGQPTVSLRAQTSGVRVQLNVRLFDLANDGKRQLITRGTFLLEGATGDAEFTIPTYGNLWQMPAEHRLELHVTTVDTPYIAPSRVPSVTRISRVRLELPIRR